MKNSIIKTGRLTFLAGVLLFLCSCTNNNQKEKNSDGNSEAIQHAKVYSEEGRFAGWPANHGIWSWEDEILVGFVEAAYRETEGLHTYDQNTARYKYARSQDGGLTWTIEDAYKHGQTGWGYDHDLSDEEASALTELKEPIDDFTDSDFIITFVRENNDNGPSHFYYSNNRGEEWNGPFRFPNLDTPGVATRTDYLVNGEQELSAFLTIAKSNKEEGRVAYARTDDGGLNWEIVSRIGPESDGFNIMPSSVRLSETEILTTIRTRTADGLDLITAYRSEDNGENWQKLSDPVADTGRGGSPPALLKMEDGRLALAYIYRSEHGSRVNIRFSDDEGDSWSDEIMLRGGDGASRDVGYPRMIQRPDGRLIIVYYWNNALSEDSSPHRYIAVTMVDPARLK